MRALGSAAARPAPPAWSSWGGPLGAPALPHPWLPAAGVQGIPSPTLTHFHFHYSLAGLPQHLGELEAQLAQRNSWDPSPGLIAGQSLAAGSG